MDMPYKYMFYSVQKSEY